MRVAVTGAAGRLGSALVAALADAPFTGPAGPIAWDRTAFDLDAPDGIGARIDRDRPEVVVHAAAWTDVDGCAREPELALARNGRATDVLARACAERGLDLAIVSTNEVFDGTLPDGAAYGPDDEPNPINPYGVSKLAARGRGPSRLHGECRASLGIVRTAWLFGAPETDFPGRILAAAGRARDGRHGPAGRRGRVGDADLHPRPGRGRSSTCSPRMPSAGPITSSTAASPAGPTGPATSFRRAGLTVEIDEIAGADWPRASTPPARAILAQTPMPFGTPLRSWPDAMADYAPTLLRTWRRSA